MGRRKFRLSVHRKNEERKKQQRHNLKKPAGDTPLTVTIPRNLISISAFKISIPVSAYRNGHVSSVDQLHSRLRALSLPKSWIVASTTPLVLSRVRVQPQTTKAVILFSVTIDDQLRWSLSYLLVPNGVPYCEQSHSC